MKPIRGYKALNKDLTSFYGDADYSYWETIREYEVQGEIEVCGRGLHYCKKAADVFNYYQPTISRFFEVEDIGTDRDSHGGKTATNKLRFIREISIEEMVKLCKSNNLGVNNTGTHNIGNSNAGCHNLGNQNVGPFNLGDHNVQSSNTGSCNVGAQNVGNYNVGFRNIGSHNVGDYNVGRCNVGDWNKTNRQTGFFNTKEPETIMVFNKPCNSEVWYDADKPWFLYRAIPSSWVPWNVMSDEEKQQQPYAQYRGGYTKSISMEEAWARAFQTADDGDIKLLKALPNYDYEVFKEITGIEDDRLK